MRIGLHKSITDQTWKFLIVTTGMMILVNGIAVVTNQLKPSRRKPKSPY